MKNIYLIVPCRYNNYTIYNFQNGYKFITSCVYFLLIGVLVLPILGILYSKQLFPDFIDYSSARDNK